MTQLENEGQMESLENVVLLSIQTLKFTDKLNLKIGLQGPYQNTRGESFFLIDFYGEKNAEGKVGNSLGTIHTLKYALEEHLNNFKTDNGTKKYYLSPPSMKLREEGMQSSPSDSFMVGSNTSDSKPVWVIDIHQLYNTKNPPVFLDIFKFPNGDGQERSFELRPGYGSTEKQIPSSQIKS